MRTARYSSHLGGGGGVCPGVVCLPGGVHPHGQTDTCENITLPQLMFGNNCLPQAENHF